MPNDANGQIVDILTFCCFIFFSSQDELKHALTKMGQDFSENQILKIIERVDKDKDGRINYEGWL